MDAKSKSLRFLSGAKKVVRSSRYQGFKVQYSDDVTYLVTDNLYQQLRDAAEVATNKRWHDEHPLKKMSYDDYIVKKTTGLYLREFVTNENGDAANEASDPHEGMVQGYDGQWRWL